MSEDVDQPHAAALTGHDPKHPANKTFRWRRSFWDYLQERRQRLLALFSLSTIVLGALLYLIVSPGRGDSRSSFRGRWMKSQDRA